MNRFLYCFLFLGALYSCDGSSAGNIKFRQYYQKGEQLYLTHCSNCHQKDGKGFALLYPPLDSSDYLLKPGNDVLCLIKYGKSGEMTVNSRTYNQPMPAFTQLSDIEIAQIATYIYNSWSNKGEIIEVKDVTKNLSACKIP